MTTPQTFQFTPFFSKETPVTFERYNKPSPIKRKKKTKTMELNKIIPLLIIVLFIFFVNEKIGFVILVCYVSYFYLTERFVPQQRRSIIKGERERGDGRGDRVTKDNARRQRRR